MHSILMDILAEKRREVSRLRKTMPPLQRDFKGAISLPGRVGLIAEIKFASPSAGVIREKADPIAIGRAYEQAGAAAVSLITDKQFFGGDPAHLPRLKGAISLPILRKDFIIDELRVKESLCYGADAVLLIARILSHQQLKGLLATSQELGLAALTEVHDGDDLEKAVDCGAAIIGINNRDLDTFEVNLQTTLELAPLVPEECVLVSESGIGSGEDIRALKSIGIRAVLVGSLLMKSNNVAAKTTELVDAGYK